MPYRWDDRGAVGGRECADHQGNERRARAGCLKVPIVSVPASSRSRARRGTIPTLFMNLALAIGLSAGGLLIAPTPALGWDPGAFSKASEDQLVALQNQARASAGLRTLKPDPTLQAAARWRAKDMAQRDYFGHTIKGTDRKVFWYLQYKYDYCFKVAGENLGTVTWEGASAEEVSAWAFDAWMNSAGHRAAILGEAWDSIGIGSYRADDGRYVWTVLFADRCASAKASPKPTPKPTPKATPRPTARPNLRATPRPTPRPTPKPTPRPTPVAIPRPASIPDATATAPATPKPIATTVDPTRSPVISHPERAVTAPWPRDDWSSPTHFLSGRETVVAWVDAEVGGRTAPSAMPRARLGIVDTILGAFTSLFGS